MLSQNICMKIACTQLFQMLVAMATHMQINSNFTNYLVGPFDITKVCAKFG